MSHPVLGLRFTFLSNLQQKVRWLAGPLVLTVLLVFSAWVVLLHVWVLQSSNWPSLCAYVVFRLLHASTFPSFLLQPSNYLQNQNVGVIALNVFIRGEWDCLYLTPLRNKPAFGHRSSLPLPYHVFLSEQSSFTSLRGCSVPL